MRKMRKEVLKRAIKYEEKTKRSKKKIVIECIKKRKKGKDLGKK